MPALATLIDPTKPDTWPAVLTIEDMAAIYSRTEEAIRHDLKPGRGRVARVPLPFMRRPARWRKADILRHIQGGR